MADAAHRVVYRRDYLPPDYLVDGVELRFELGEETTVVTSRLLLRRNPDLPSDVFEVIAKTLAE
ncbi:MAG: hypothetical protein HYV06_10265 [Deltaproteobacteria bacterium]|nr:hypothetical protein [Deltaproteobacteria bacterium]